MTDDIRDSALRTIATERAGLDASMPRWRMDWADRSRRPWR
jgi:hypothetical protein